MGCRIGHFRLNTMVYHVLPTLDSAKHASLKVHAAGINALGRRGTLKRYGERPKRNTQDQCRYEFVVG